MRIAVIILLLGLLPGCTLMLLAEMVQRLKPAPATTASAAPAAAGDKELWCYASLAQPVCYSEPQAGPGVGRLIGADSVR